MGEISHSSNSHYPATIDNSKNLSVDIGNSFDNELFSDLMLIVNGERFKVHKIILASRSEYFRSLLTSGWSEMGQKEIPINEANTRLFEKLLRYIYSDTLLVCDLEETLELWLMSNKYLLTKLQKSIEEQLVLSLTPETFFTVYSMACDFSATYLKTRCLEMADENMQSILRSNEFVDCSVDYIDELIQRDSVKWHQPELFQALSRWIERNGRTHSERLFSKIRLSKMPMHFLLTTARRCGLFSQDRIQDAISDTLYFKAPTDRETKAASFLIHVKVIETFRNPAKASSVVAPINWWVHSHDTIRKLKRGLRNAFGALEMGTIRSASEDGGEMYADRRTLEYYGICSGTNLVYEFVSKY